MIIITLASSAELAHSNLLWIVLLHCMYCFQPSVNTQVNTQHRIQNHHISVIAASLPSFQLALGTKG